MRDLLSDLGPEPSDADPVRRAQIQMKRPQAKRFYTTVDVRKDQDGVSVLLDGKPIKTPGKNVLRLPTVEAAELVAAEWRAQGELIDPGTMPATRLANTAIDAVAAQADVVFQDIVRYSANDLLFYRAETPQELVERQAELWDPVVDWAASSHGARFILAAGIIHQEQPEAAIAAFAKALRRYDTPFELAGLHVITALTGSALLALAFAEGYLSLQEIWALAHLDEDWTDEHWGIDTEAQSRRAKRYEDLDAAARIFQAARSSR
ncbi:MAG: ATP12 family protein [Rhizobium sp.]